MLLETCLNLSLSSSCASLSLTSSAVFSVSLQLLQPLRLPLLPETIVVSCTLCEGYVAFIACARAERALIFKRDGAKHELSERIVYSC